MDWYAKSFEETLNAFKTDIEGLNSSDIAEKMNEHGPNEIIEKGRLSLVTLFFSQFLNPLIIILLVAAFLKFAIASTLDGSVILATIAFMIFVAFFQEAKAEKALEALKKLSAPKAKVKRNGEKVVIPSKELVPGDILLLEAGDSISADARLIHTTHLQVNEASLTGESLPIQKQTDPLPAEINLAERNNMVYSGTTISYGKGIAVVCATGMQTELGKIAAQLQSTKKESTPLQKSIKRLGNWMLLTISGVIGIFLAIGISLNMNWVDLFLLCVAIAVAAIPEGLPATVTVVLASGVHQISKQKGIIRKLIAVETLGSADVICTDKTGTLTQNQMALTQISTKENDAKWHEEKWVCNGIEREISSILELVFPLKIGALCCDVSVSKKDNEDIYFGDPTEIAVIEALRFFCMDKNALDKSYPKQLEIPFKSENQYMATLHQIDDEMLMLIKGSPEKILKNSKYIFGTKGKEPINEKELEILNKKLEKMAEQGLRILATAYKPCKIEEFYEENATKDLIFTGFLGMIDPPREEAKLAIEKCKRAGIVVKMITGDNQVTAKAIGAQLGLETHSVITGYDIEGFDDKTMEKVVEENNIFARIEPIHKFRIVKSYKNTGHIVGMTGDGVNDAPALEAADIGISMGITGTDVAKEASDIILTDDNFATIIDCIEEGRSIFNRLRHSAAFLLTTCFGELATILFAFLFTQTSPLEPLQILWINLITGSMIAIPIGMEPKIGDELSYPPRHHKVGLLFPGMIFRIAYLSSTLSIGVFLIFYITLNNNGIVLARSMTFCSIVLFEWFMALNMRSDELPVSKIGVFSNRMLNMTSAIALLLLIAIIYVPFLEQSFGTTSLSLREWGICLIPGVSVYILETFRKKFFPALFSCGKWKPWRKI